MTPETLDYLRRVTQGMAKAATMIQDDTAAVIATQDHIEVIKHYNSVRIAVELIKEAKKGLEAIEEKLSREEVPTVMRANNIKNIFLEDIGRVQLNNRYSCSITDKPKGYAWLRANNAESLIQETVNSSTLSSFAKHYMEDEGKELPAEEGFKVSTMTFTSITKK